jgi:transposase
MREKRRKYTKEFKIDAVRLIVEEGKVDAFPGKGRLSPEDEELRQLRRKNKRLLMERDILKKAVAIFSKEPQ